MRMFGFSRFCGWRGVLAVLLPLGAMAEPLVCEQPDFPFGAVNATTGIVAHTFELRNASPAPLVIDEVASPCGCIALHIETNQLAAGEGTRLPVTLDLRRRNGAQRLAVHVCYHTAGAEDAAILSLTLQGTVLGTNQPANDASAASAASVTNQSPANAAGRLVIVEMFGEAGCEACATVRREVLPAARTLLGNRGVILERDVYETTNFMVLAKYQEHFGVLKSRRNDPVSVVVDGCRYLGGVAEIRRDLPEVLRERLAATDAGAVAVAAPEVHDRLAQFTLPLVLVFGFLDGINHCAIATVIFLVSLLSVSKVRGRDYLRLGIPFCVASFVTYFLFGLGVLEGLHRLSGFGALRTGLNVLVAVGAIVLAFLSFRDAWRYRRSGNAAEVSLQLPRAVKQVIHTVMRRGIGGRSLILGGLMAGVVVTLLEGICTGQVYVPTLAMIARTEHGGRALRYLLAYNVASDVPLIVVLVLGYIGIRTETLLRLSRRNVLLSKVLTGIFFVILAILMLAA